MNIDTTAQSDLDALTALNRDYIKSVQDGDVRRFDEILAADFLCSNPLMGRSSTRSNSWSRPLNR